MSSLMVIISEAQRRCSWPVITGHLIEKWGVDVLTSAKYYTSNRLISSCGAFIESATPLFVAAFRGHGHIVRYLLEKGADASVKTTNQTDLNYNGLTPLYGAVYRRVFTDIETTTIAEERRGRSAIVRYLLEFGANPSIRPSSRRPIWMEELCDVDSITALINHGLDLKQRYLDSGETILHYFSGHPRGFTEEDSSAIVRLLVERGADLLARDIQGFTPILRAANSGYSRRNFSILDYLLELDGIGRMEKIDALELAGASILLDDRNASLLPKAFGYWRRAYHLREMEKDASGSSAEKSLGPKKGGTKEWTSLAELENVIQRPEEYTIQSLHVRFRVLSVRSWEAVEMEAACYSMFYSWYHPTATHKLLEMKLAALNTICRFNPRDALKGLHFKLQESTIEVVNAVSGLLNSPMPNATQLPFETYETSLDLIFLALNLLKPDYFSRFGNKLFALLEEMFRLPGMLSVESHRNSMIRLLRERVGSYRLGFILLLACEHERYVGSLAIIRLFLEAGADPNAGLDLDGYASLHLVAEFEDPKLSEAAAILLLGKGAHHDRVNNAGQTAADVWIQTRIENGAETGWNARPDWCRTVPNLLCLAARSVRIHKIPYKKETPATLHSTVAMH